MFINVNFINTFQYLYSHIKTVNFYKNTLHLVTRAHLYRVISNVTTLLHEKPLRFFKQIVDSTKSLIIHTFVMLSLCLMAAHHSASVLPTVYIRRLILMLSKC